MSFGFGGVQAQQKTIAPEIAPPFRVAGEFVPQLQELLKPLMTAVAAGLSPTAPIIGFTPTQQQIKELFTERMAPTAGEQLVQSILGGRALQAANALGVVGPPRTTDVPGILTPFTPTTVSPLVAPTVPPPTPASSTTDILRRLVMSGALRPAEIPGAAERLSRGESLTSIPSEAFQGGSAAGINVLTRPTAFGDLVGGTSADISRARGVPEGEVDVVRGRIQTRAQSGVGISPEGRREFANIPGEFLSMAADAVIQRRISEFDAPQFAYNLWLQARARPGAGAS